MPTTTMPATKKSRVSAEERAARRDAEILIHERIEDVMDIEAAKVELTYALTQTMYEHGLSDVEPGEVPEGYDRSRFEFLEDGTMINSTRVIKNVERMVVRHDASGQAYVVNQAWGTVIGITKTGKFYSNVMNSSTQVFRKNADGAWIRSIKTKNRSFRSENMTFNWKHQGFYRYSRVENATILEASYISRQAREDEDVETKLSEHVDPIIGTRASVYPLADHYELETSYDYTPEFVKAFAHATTPAELTRNLFGARAVRKDLVRAVAKARALSLTYVHALRRRDVPIDWYVQAINQIETSMGEVKVNKPVSIFHRYAFTSHAPKSMRAWTKDLDLASRRRLLVTLWRRGDVENQLRAMNDLPFFTVRVEDRADNRFVHAINPMAPITTVDGLIGLERQINTRANARRREIDARWDIVHGRHEAKVAAWRASEMGQRLMAAQDEAERRRLEAEEAARQRRLAEEAVNHAERVERYEKLSAALDEFNESDKAVSLGMRVVIAGDAKQLAEWSDLLDNCIWSYSRHLEDRSSMLIGLYEKATKINEVGDTVEHEALIANLEINIAGSRLMQFLGNHNRDVPIEKRQPLLDVFEANGIATNEYWGK